MIPSHPAERHIQTVQSLMGQRKAWESLWQELADICHPRRNLIARKPGNDAPPDRRTLAENSDGTAMRSNITLANGQASRITPMGARWFMLQPPEDLSENADARAWYHRCSEIMAKVFYRSNFYSRAHEHYLDRGAFGTAATEVLAAANGKGLHFRSYPVGDFACAHNAEDEVETLARTVQLTPAQIIERFPDTAPADVRKAFDEPAQRHIPHEVLHLIEPRSDRDPRKIDAKNKPFASVFIHAKTQTILSESGFDSFPVAVSRWALWGHSPYGWAPSYAALPEASQANYLEQMLDTQAEVALFPRVRYGSNLKGDIDFRAMGLTCYDPNLGQTPPEEWLANGRYDIGKDRLADKRRAIEDAFFVPLFNAISTLDRDATATEVRAIVQESREMFHPIFSGLTREFLRPILQRSFAILLQQGAFPQPPRSVIRGDDFGAFIENPEVEFTSAMALALENSHAANLADMLNILLPVAGADPAVLDFIDWQEVGPLLFRAKGLPASFILSPERIAEIQAARAQAAQAQQAAQASQAVRNVGGARGMADLADLADTAR